MRLRCSLALVAVILSGACSTSDSACTPTEACTDVHAFADSVSGTWAEVGMVPGASLVLTFAMADTIVTGGGTYSIEAGRSGNVALGGVVKWMPESNTPGGTAPAHADLDVNITWDYGQTAVLNQARLIGADSLRAVINYAPVNGSYTSVVATFARRK